MDIYRLFHPGKYTDVIKAIENHVQLYPQCSDQLMWDESGKIQRGSSWREQLKCDTCSFVSKSHNLYTESNYFQILISTKLCLFGQKGVCKYKEFVQCNAQSDDHFGYNQKTAL